MKINSNIFWGLFLVLLGVLFLMDNLDFLDARQIISDYWPVVLVFVGIYILLKSKSEKSGEPFRSANDQSAKESKVHKLNIDTLSESGVFGDIEIAVESNNFQGGSVTNIFGDIDLDLSQSVIAEGEQIIRVSGVFGDISVDVPSDIPISVSGTTFFGDVKIRDYKKGGIGQSINYTSDDFQSAPKKLHIDISHIFGDVTIR